MFNVAVVGATGAVGGTMLRVLEERGFPVTELRPLASSRSAGRELDYLGRPRTVRQLTAGSVRKWNAFFRERIEAIAAAYPPVEPVDLDQLAGMMSCIVDGGIIMSKALEDPAILPQQVLLFRSYIKLLFQR